MERRRFRSVLAALLFGVAILCTPLPAALVQTGSVVPAINSWNSTIQGYIGLTSDGGVLVNSGSTLTSGSAFVGRSAGFTGMATVTGAGSMWTNSYGLYVGYDGDGTLSVADGGKVITTELYASLSHLMGNGMITATQGAVLDADLLFDAAHGTVQNLAFGSGGTLNVSFGGASLGVGYKQSGSMTVTEGRDIWSSKGYLGFFAGSEGTATVSGSGSSWTNSSSLLVGSNGSGTLIVDEGGFVNTGTAQLGSAAGAAGTAIVTGEGSKWTINGPLDVGNRGTGTLSIEYGAQVASSSGSLGKVFGSTGAVTVAGTGSKWTNNATLYVGSGGSGTLTIEAGGQVSNTTGELGFNHSTGQVYVTGPGSSWTNSGNLYVGHSGTGTLIVQGGGVVSSNAGYVDSSSSTSSTVTVTGEGSLWSNSGPLIVGENGSGSLSIEDGAQVTSSGGILGLWSGSTGAVTVAGTGSKWTNSGGLVVGELGNGTMTVTDGAEVVATTLTGSLSGISGNGTIAISQGVLLDADLLFDATHGPVATIPFGSGGTLSFNATGNILGVGYKQSGTLTVSAGRSISTSNGYLGNRAGSNGVATVTGLGSAWTNNVFYVGDRGNGSLSIEAGGQVNTTTGYLGNQAGATGAATVTGAGSKWTNSGTLYVGRDGSGTMTVADGGEVVTAKLYASVNNLSGNGTITATQGAVLDADVTFDAAHETQAIIPFGSGGTLLVNTEGGILGVGYKQSGTVTVTGGANVTSGEAFLGYSAGSTGVATVTGTGSKWKNTLFHVGYQGSGTLMISAGGQVSSVFSIVGNGSTAKVTGPGSIWTNTGSLDIGSLAGSSLTIESGGKVISEDGSIAGEGFSSSVPKGTVTVTGVGSTWTNSGDLNVGGWGSGNLNILSGGLVSTAGQLDIRSNYGPSAINMATGGMLALWGDADGSLGDFLRLVDGGRAISFWDSWNWSRITSADYGEDYTLEYLTTGDLAGYTLLTVGRVGDFDNDGDVDGRDLLAWQRHPELGSLADWQVNYASSLTTQSAFTAVPEPASAVLVLLACTLILPVRCMAP